MYAIKLKENISITYYNNEIQEKLEQRCFGFLLCRKISAPKEGVESEEENESY